MFSFVGGKKKVMHAQAEILPARTWAARVLQQLTGKDYSEHIMPIQVPGPSAAAAALDEVAVCVCV